MDWLKAKRVEKKMTHEEVAKRSGISRTAYSFIERGERRPSVDTAKAIAEVLDFHWTQFFEQIPEPNEGI